MLKDIEKAFELTTKDLWKIIKDFHSEMDCGLAGKTSSLKMIPAYVGLATGEEKGKFIALDLGGTNFRILEVDLDGRGHAAVSRVKKFVIKKEDMTGSRRQLFGFLAECIKIFLGEEPSSGGEEKKLGFTFSFPVDQTAIDSGNLLCWTKGFSADGVIGQDVVRLLADALIDRGVHDVKVSALANDTVGTLEAGRYADVDCDVGVILGTGTNACYPEKLSNIKKLKSSCVSSGEMVINIEWGNFDKLKPAPWDKRLDRASINPGMQIMEKMVSGMYLGEIARLVLEDYGVIGKGSSFRTEDMSAIEGDSSDDRHLLRRICQIVSSRAARISAACLTAIITKIDPKLSKRHSIAIDGTVYEKHPTFAKNISECLEELLGEKAPLIKTGLVKDGSGLGVGIIAAVASSGKI